MENWILNSMDKSIVCHDNDLASHIERFLDTMGDQKQCDAF